MEQITHTKLVNLCQLRTARMSQKNRHKKILCVAPEMSSTKWTYNLPFGSTCDSATTLTYHRNKSTRCYLPSEHSIYHKKVPPPVVQNEKPKVQLESFTLIGHFTSEIQCRFTQDMSRTSTRLKGEVLRRYIFPKIKVRLLPMTPKVIIALNDEWNSKIARCQQINEHYPQQSMISTKLLLSKINYYIYSKESLPFLISLFSMIYAPYPAS